MGQPHPTRPIMFITDSQIRNLKARLVIDEDGCLIWTGAKFRFGHGQIKIGSVKNNTRKLEATHRVAYFLEHGELPRGGVVRHSCDKPACCLPDHLVPGTQQDNMDDMVARGRSTGNCRDNRGEGNPSAKLTWEEVRAIRREPVTATNVDLGIKYGVTHSMISAIRLNKSWKEL